MQPNHSEYDVIVIGGGPAGSTAAALIAREGHRVLLLDRETFPRFRIGESLMPATYGTLERLGVVDRMQSSSFPRKFSVQFFAKDGASSIPFYFSEVCDEKSSMTWQVDRLEFDGMLLDNARECGAEMVLRANVRDLLVEEDRVKGVRVELENGRNIELRSTVVVDASGQTGFISRRLGLKETDAELRHLSYYTRYKGGVRGEGRDEGATLILHTRRERVWFWYIPLPDNHVSVGIVGPVNSLTLGASGDRHAFFEDEIAQCKPLAERLAPATRVMPVDGIRDFSYISTAIAGNGWVSAGDAFGFLDPIYSSGVFLALKGAEMGADSVLDAFAQNDFSGERLGQHGPSFLAGMEAMRKLVYAFYSPDFNFKAFLKRFPECRDDLVNLLVGNVYNRSPQRLLDAMGQMCELPEERKLA